VDRINKKLEFWCTAKINTTGRTVVVNHVLLSALFFFIAIWAGSQLGIVKCKSAIRSFMWFGTMHRIRVKVAWLQCCQDKSMVGLGLVNPVDALTSLMCKWVIKASEPSSSNLHILLQFRLSHYQPYRGGRWALSLSGKHNTCATVSPRGSYE